MGSSAKTGKIFFRGSPEHFMDKNAIWDRTPPHLHINCSLHVWRRAQGSQIFKWNSIILIRSKVMAFLVILLSPCGPHRPRVFPSSQRCPRVVSVIPTLSPCCPHRPHSPQKVPMWSPWSMVSTCCPHCPHRPHVIPIVPTSFPHCPRRPHSPQKVPMWSPWSVVSTCCPRHPRCPHVIPVIPTSSPHRPHHHHIILVVLIAPRRSPCGLLGLWSPHVVPIVPRLSLSYPHHLEGPHIISKPPDTHST